MNSTVIPSLRYARAPEAIDFLCTAFGFQRHAVFADDTDPSLIHHAQLTLHGGMIMLGSARPNEAQQLYNWKSPGEAGCNTVILYVYVPDADAHHAQATAAGATILTAPKNNDGYPGRGYSARDTEGYVWGFGSYDPWAP
jgi:uncharacterized glyoxalase superfamily protein PhnB